MVNKVILMGRVCGNPEVKRSDDGKVAFLKLDTSHDNGRSLNRGVHTIVLQEKLVETVEKDLIPNSVIYVEGEIRYHMAEINAKDKDGNIFKLIRKEDGIGDGQTSCYTRENDGMLFYVTKNEDGTLFIISEEEDRKIAEESKQATEELYNELEEFGGTLPKMKMVLFDEPKDIVDGGKEKRSISQALKQGQAVVLANDLKILSRT